MKKFLFFLIPILLVIATVFGFLYFTAKAALGKGALQVTANPKSKVILDGKLIGTTPLCKCETNEMLPVGDHTIRIEPEDSTYAAFEEKIQIAKSILTVVDRTFGQGVTSEGSIITLSPIEKKNGVELLVLSFPDGAQVLLDNNPVGNSPLLLKDITESDHEILVKKDGYKEKDVRIRTVAGYKLSAAIYLGVGTLLTPTPTLAPSVTATPSAALSPKVTILDTPTGFLRVRDASNSAGVEIGRVNPGEKLDLLEESDEWFQIKLGNGAIGWISTQYAKKE